MGYQPRKLPKSGIHEYKKPLREKGKIENIFVNVGN
jgi:hypothetical protein